MDNKAQTEAMDRAVEIPLERRVAERRALALASHPAAPVQPASNDLELPDTGELTDVQKRSVDCMDSWAAQSNIPKYSELLTLAKGYNDVIRSICFNYSAGGYNSEGFMAPKAADHKLRWIIDDVRNHAANWKPAAPPVQQSGDVREAWEYSFTHSSALDKGDADIGPCLTYDRSIAYGVGCFNQRQVVIGQALATTRPSAALTDEKIDELYRECAYTEAGEAEIRFARAILAASGGALAASEAAPLPAEQPSNPVARIVQAFPLEGGKTVRREDRGNGVHGWLLYDEQGKLVRGLNMFEQGFIDAALSTSKMIYPVEARIFGQQTKGGGK